VGKKGEEMPRFATMVNVDLDRAKIERKKDASSACLSKRL